MFSYSGNAIKAASYSRLSREDGDKIESYSIRNQKDLIADYASQKGIRIVEEYTDDGYSGVNFERPSFQRMIEDVKKKKINCIIVKDLSRLGRNYIETGRYIERIFPFLGVRFIAITDHYDSADESGDADQIIIPFKNLINDAYCRDISIKIRSQLDVKRKNGKFIGSFAAYGYLKDPNDKNHLIIDEYAAEIIRTIFGLKLNGLSSQRISEKLDEMNIAPPLEYKRKCGLNFNSGFRSGRNPKWTVVTVNRILHNELYVGTMVQGKNRKINYKVKESRPIEETDWIRVPETHEAIIQKPIFDTVQRLTELDTRTAPTSEGVYILSGFLRCGDCGQNMIHRSVVKNGKTYGYYYCSTYKRGDGCSPHNISEAKLKDNVLLLIKREIGLVLRAEKILSLAKNVTEQKIGVKSIDTRLSGLTAEIERYKELKAKLYRDFTDGIVGREDFKEINTGFTEKLNSAAAAQEQMLEKREKLISHEAGGQQWIETFKKYRDVTELNRSMVASLIECIVVYDSDTVEVHFRCEDEIEEMFEAAASVSGEFAERKECAV